MKTRVSRERKDKVFTIKELVNVITLVYYFCISSSISRIIYLKTVGFPF